ncbi:hypothetical protein L6164_026582 [Bauhinia variegata]|uniref:Uncharacterized protein n=1 Tax=Bauhinia variegata TaxID=167791 RepID=A0ACB9LR11_BAUVA|nr:hypothetical protein L6164_026582 [Bauhinia variegata]
MAGSLTTQFKLNLKRLNPILSYTRKHRKLWLETDRVRSIIRINCSSSVSVPPTSSAANCADDKEQRRRLDLKKNPQTHRVRVEAFPSAPSASPGASGEAAGRLGREMRTAIISASVIVLVLGFCLDLGFGHEGHHHSGACPLEVHESHGHKHQHQCGHGHHHHHHHHHHEEEKLVTGSKLPEELAEEEDMRLYGFGLYEDHDHTHFGGSELSGLGLWLNALGCSFLVSIASLICLITLPIIFVQGKPSKAVVDSLALFGAGAMLGDAFLHQLPHAFGGEHPHSHSDHEGHSHDAGFGHGHSHSLADLSTGISILAGIVLFLLVEKVVRYVEDNSGGANTWSHGHHHHHHNSNKKLKDDNDSHANSQSESLKADDSPESKSSLRKRVSSTGAKDDKLDGNAADSTGAKDDKLDGNAANLSAGNIKSLNEEDVQSPRSLVLGYLNLFSDGVHNFTDGMALGSAFLVYGSVGGWSRTLFLLAHEIPQEVGDFGILVRSGFSIQKALFFNFLSALMALAGTVLALLLGQDPGQSSLIEGFTAGGFIYIAIGVLAEMNSSGKTTLRSSAVQVTSLAMGMLVAIGISLVE